MTDPTGDVRVVLCTCPEREALRISHGLVEEGLAACVNIASKITSVYRWEGKVHEDREALLVIKTAAAKIAAMREGLLALHPYEVPEILVLGVDTAASNPAYVDWVLQSTT